MIRFMDQLEELNPVHFRHVKINHKRVWTIGFENFRIGFRLGTANDIEVVFQEDPVAFDVLNLVVKVDKVVFCQRDFLFVNLSPLFRTISTSWVQLVSLLFRFDM